MKLKYAVIMSALAIVPGIQAGSPVASSITTSSKSPATKAPIEQQVVMHKAPSRWTVTPFVGATFPISGDLTSQAWAMPSVEIDTNPTDIDEFYDVLLGGGLEFGYELRPGLSAIVGVSAFTGEGEDNALVGYANNTDPLYASFDDYGDVGVYGGLKYGSQPAVGAIGTHVKALAGVRFVEGIDASLSSSGFQTGEVSVFDDSVLFEAKLLVGASYGVSENVAIGIEGGVALMTGFDGDDSDLSGFGLSDFNEPEELFTVPARLFIDIKF